LKISGETRLCVVIGDPVEHSLSPCIHNAAFQHLDLDYVYVALRVREDTLKDAIVGARSLGIFGLNVTMPHKVRIIEYLDRLDETAWKVGAVNTVLNDVEMVGYNTDGIGVLSALKAHGADLRGKKAIILGAGGASRSISFGLAEEASDLVILNRTPEKAEALTNRISATAGKRVRWAKLSSGVLGEEIRDADIVVNATSVGMHPGESQTPVDKHLLRPELTVFDLVYNPLETRLLREARSIGARTIDGLTHLIHQGAASFEIWTGSKAPIEVMTNAAKCYLKEMKSETGEN